MTDDQPCDEGTTPGEHAGQAEGGGERIARREALKKAIAGTTVAGAVWVAPKVEGLSVIPDYAAAGTGTAGPIRFRIQAAKADTNNYYANSDRNNNWRGLTGCTGADDWAVAVSSSNPGITLSPIGPGPSGPAAGAFNGSFDMVAPLGLAGNATVTVPGGFDSDLPGGVTQTINVTFSIDPPWNRCRISNVVFNKCNPSSPGVGSFNIVNNPGPNVPNPTGFVAQVEIGPQPANHDTLDIFVECT